MLALPGPVGSGLWADIPLPAVPGNPGPLRLLSACCCPAVAGVRIMEVRQAYATEDFEWANLKRLAIEGLEQQNTLLLREHAAQRFGTLLNQAGDGSSSSSEQPSSEQQQEG